MANALLKPKWIVVKIHIKAVCDIFWPGSVFTCKNLTTDMA